MALRARNRERFLLFLPGCQFCRRYSASDERALRYMFVRRATAGEDIAGAPQIVFERHIATCGGAVRGSTRPVISARLRAAQTTVRYVDEESTVRHMSA